MTVGARRDTLCEELEIVLCLVEVMRCAPSYAACPDAASNGIRNCTREMSNFVTLKFYQKTRSANEMLQLAWPIYSQNERN